MTDAQTRADLYLLLAALLREPPEAVLLETLRALEVSGDDELAEALRALQAAATGADPEALVDEFHTLFIGVTQGELLPYASWYRRGFLHETPLVELRHDLARLGICRSGPGEPEDHVAALCEAMALLVLEDHPGQGDFFRNHLAPWIGRFFRDLARADGADFYRRVGTVGERFMARDARVWGG
ncbi:hypothetical protein MIN45_P0993 [Methylomarinovum tepidoasis]|uniref:Molecular chaperone TorD n=1 Tax=Methylomarinovum tepidoasis TaxID=2840183 RepID=A0AAU9C644_9GAMM|nr:molecular chaperone TorD family protein [Methylomarinovum sp. IN45]BCX88624.1 hypothetical protein MIN45_P0993 [Methylomarinovum sp. IN45]